MKKVLFTLVTLSVLFFVSCKKEEVEQQSQKEKLLGKWMLQRAQEELYSPATNLISSDEYIGEPGDSLVFMRNDILYSYTDSDVEETNYNLVNDSTLDIEQERWKIATLTDRELTLVQDETLMNERYVLRIFMVR